jgi:hypothetical protein
VSTLINASIEKSERLSVELSAVVAKAPPLNCTAMFFRYESSGPVVHEAPNSFASRNGPASPLENTVRPQRLKRQRYLGADETTRSSYSTTRARALSEIDWRANAAYSVCSHLS